MYFSDHAYDVEYDYWFHTNNYGLVQDFDVAPTRRSILLLGDSFMEGQGAEPWFRQLAEHADTLPYQIINGGLFGTGFEQFGKLERYLSEEKKVQIRKLIVVFISDDYVRQSWHFSEEFLHCLQRDAFCNSGDGDFNRRPTSSELLAREMKYANSESLGCHCNGFNSRPESGCRPATACMTISRPNSIKMPSPSKVLGWQ